jgi:hypothetical protein
MFLPKVGICKSTRFTTPKTNVDSMHIACLQKLAIPYLQDSGTKQFYAGLCCHSIQFTSSHAIRRQLRLTQRFLQLQPKFCIYFLFPHR